MSLRNNSKQKQQQKQDQSYSSSSKKEEEKEIEENEKNQQFWKPIISSIFEHNYINGLVVFNLDGIAITSKNINTKSFPKEGINLFKYFEKSPLGQYLNKSVVSECGYDLLGPGYNVEGVTKYSIFGFNPTTKCGFSLEKTKTTFILGTFNETQDKFDAYGVIGSLASDFRSIDL